MKKQYSQCNLDFFLQKNKNIGQYFEEDSLTQIKQQINLNQEKLDKLKVSYDLMSTQDEDSDLLFGYPKSQLKSDDLQIVIKHENTQNIINSVDQYKHIANTQNNIQSLLGKSSQNLGDLILMQNFYNQMADQKDSAKTDTLPKDLHTASFFSKEDNQAANGPSDYPEISFVPSGNTPWIDLAAPIYDKQLAESRRQQFLTFKHSIKEKMELYNTSTKGKLEELKEILGDKQYSLTEEISKSGYYWTVLHYASHYGHYEVLSFLLGFLENHPNKFEIFNMQTTEGKTPLFCAILSGDIGFKAKQQIIKLWFDTNSIDLKLRKQSGEDLLQLASKNKLYEFIVEFCLRED